MKKLLNTKFTFPQKILLLVFPLVYFTLGSYFRNLLGNLSLRSCDPEYIYFMSGLTLSDGAIKLGHVDNPGTPLQILVAVVFKLTYFIRSTSVNYVDDVFLHPDLYLSVTSLFITAVIAGLVFYSGYKVLKYTKSIFYALIIQTAPFLPVIWYDLIGRVAPELLMPFPVVLLTVLLLKIYYQKEPFTYQYVVLLAFFSAFGLSIKLSFLPLLIIPFMVIEGWKKRLIFTASAIVLFSIIAFPMTLQFHIFWDWVKNLVLHSGTYGQGDTNIIDFASLQKNLRELIGYEKKYFYLFLTLIGTLAAYLILYKKKVEKRIVIFAIAVIATIALQLLLVGKHYAHRYFIPVLLLSPFMVFIISELIKKLIPHKFTHVFINIGMICFLLWSIQLNQAWLPLKTEAMQTDIENRMPTWHFAQSLDKNSYKIITSQNYGCPFIEYTLMYSTAWANNKKKAEYAPILGKLYPNTYNYFTWDNTLKHWGDKFSVPQIIASGEKVYLYLERNDEELFDKTIDKLVEENGMSFSIKRELSYLNDKTNEVIYQLIFNPPATEPQNLN